MCIDAGILYKIRHLLEGDPEIVNEKCLLAVLCGETESDCYRTYQLQSLTTAAGASPHNPYPIAKIMTVNHPRGIFSRRRGIAHGGVGADGLPHKMYPVHQSNPNQVAKSLKNGLLLIWTVSHFGLYRPHFSRAASSSGARFAFSSSVTPSVHASIACMVATAPSRVPFGWPWIPPLTRRTSSVP